LGISGLARVEVGKVAVSIRRGGSLSPNVLENPRRHNGEVSLPVASKPTQIQQGGFLPLRHVEKRAHRTHWRGVSPSPLHQKFYRHNREVALPVALRRRAHRDAMRRGNLLVSSACLSVLE